MTETEEDVPIEESISVPDYYLAELKEAFSILDEDETNTIPTDELFRLIRILGFPASIDDHRYLLHKYDPDETGFIDFQSCEEIMAEKWKKVEPYHELREAFLQFDKTGYIKDKELRLIMSNLGNPLNRQELTKFMKAADVNKDGYIYWEDYVHLLNPNKLEI